jgi:ABC-type histidine transport system ATPase subunit
LEQYITDYNALLSSSTFFKQTENNSFGTYQATEILKSIEDNSYFDAGHKFVLEDGTEINNSSLLKELVEKEISNIINDEKLKQAFDKVDKAIGSNLELRAFKKVIEKDNLLLVELKDYEGFQKKIWVNYLSEIKNETEILAEIYKIKKIELEKIIEEAKKEFVLWEKIIKKFNSRFYVPFKVILINQDDIILKQETANLEFEYIDNNEIPVRQKKENLLSILSKGEQRAYFILQFLFEIESRKSSEEKNIIIFDDIADSFDYKNKFAIIEYIKELHLSSEFRMIVLTHNFDFYRTIASRLSLKRQVVYMTTKSNEKVINLKNGQYRNDVFVYFIDNYKNPKIFISLIAFVRNIIEYTESTECDDYSKLTSCLHLKNNSTELLVKDIFNIYKSRLIKLSDKTIEFENENLLDFIINTANLICIEENINEINLENKISLAIATRLKTEEYLIDKLPEVNLDEITSNQTSELFLKYKTKFPESNAIEILENVNLMTPENIHINAFMYEPLIDMSVLHLKDLYLKICDLN